MATGDVSKRIKQNIQRRLKSRGQDNDAALPSAIYASCDVVQNRIAEETLCFHGKTDISLSAGQETYSFPDEMISERKLVPEGGLPLVKINMDKVDILSRARETSDSSSDSVLYYYKWDNKFGFLGSGGSIPGKDSTVTCYFWRYLSDSEGMSDRIDPVVDKRWLKTIEYGALADLTGEVSWKSQYELEFKRVAGREISNRSEAFTVPYNGDYD